MTISFYRSPALPLPPGVDERRLLEWLKAVRVAGGGEEIEAYVAQDFERFVYTLSLFSGLGGEGKRAIEFGANPYFMSVLAERFSSFDWTYSNWFGLQPGGRRQSQEVAYRDFDSGEERRRLFEYYNFNSESDRFPLGDESCDLVLYCEILEHLTTDPCRPLRKIRNLLNPDGYLVLTTPNVARFENVMRMFDGKNIYDPYSGYGPYGRHNREYTRDELRQLLSYVGFEIEEIFTSDVHPHAGAFQIDPTIGEMIVSKRSEDLGQYIFVRARKSKVEGQKLPIWLYRSVAADRLATDDRDKAAALSAGFKVLEWKEASAEQPMNVRLDVTNRGTSTWDVDGLRLGAKAFDSEGRLLREFRGESIGNVAPGKSVELQMDIDASDLPVPGLEISIDLVAEHRYWFEDVGSTPLRVII